MTRELTPDQLGQKGELEFPQRCIDAQLIPNRVGWDRTGWDYIVEWPADSAPGRTLDLREAPLSLHVQVKTRWRGNDRITCRLSSLERLAKELKPAFIYILECGDDLRFTGAHVIHLDGEFLAFVLRKLRECEAASGRANHEEVNFSIGAFGEGLGETGAAFRDYVERAVDGGMFDYATRKRLHLQTLGYDESSLQITAVFKPESEDHIVDFFLGLRSVEGEITSSTETRFGVALPFPTPVTSGKFESQLDPMDRCVVRMFIPGNDRPIEFRGKLYVTPKAVALAAFFKILVRTDLFRLGFREAADDQVEIEIAMGGEVRRNARLKAAEWGDFYRFASAAADNLIKFEVVPARHPNLTGELSLLLGPEDAQRWAYAAEICEAAARALKEAGAPNTRLAIDDVFEVGREFLVLSALMDGPDEVTTLNFHTLGGDPVRDGYSTPLVYFRFLRLGGFFLGYAASTTLSAQLADGGVSWATGELNYAGVCRARGRPGLDRFVSEVKQRTGIGATFVLDAEGNTAISVNLDR